MRTDSSTAGAVGGAARIVVALVVGAAIAWTAATTAAAAKEEAFRGSVRGRTYVHAYKMPMDIGVDREFKPGERVDEERVRVHVPDHYGSLIEIMPAGTAPDESVVLWFRDEHGVLRNALVHGVTRDLLHIEMVPTRSIDVDYR